MNNAVKYHGRWLAKSSDAYALFDKKEFAKLDELLKDVDTKFTKSTGGHDAVNYSIGQTVTEYEFEQWINVDGPAMSLAFGARFTPVGPRMRLLTVSE